MSGKLATRIIPNLQCLYLIHRNDLRCVLLLHIPHTCNCMYIQYTCLLLQFPRNLVYYCYLLFLWKKRMNKAKGKKDRTRRIKCGFTSKKILTLSWIWSTVFSCEITQVLYVYSCLVGHPSCSPFQTWFRGFTWEAPSWWLELPGTTWKTKSLAGKELGFWQLLTGIKAVPCLYYVGRVFF